MADWSTRARVRLVSVVRPSNEDFERQLRTCVVLGVLVGFLVGRLIVGRSIDRLIIVVVACGRCYVCVVIANSIVDMSAVILDELTFTLGLVLQLPLALLLVLLLSLQLLLRLLSTSLLVHVAIASFVEVAIATEIGSAPIRAR